VRHQSWRATEPFFTPAVAFWLSLSMRARAAQPPKHSRDIILVEVVTTFSSFRFPELSQLIWNFSSLGSLRKAAYPMNPSAILHEVQQLYNVSDRLDSLAEQHPFATEALIAISGSVRNTATLLEVVVATKMGMLSGLDPANA